MPVQLANLSSNGIEVLPHGSVKIPGHPFKYYYSETDISEADTMKVKYLEERWDYMNHHLFGGVMTRPPFFITRHKKRLGAWYPGMKKMEFSKMMFKQPDEYTLLGTLAHEMAHQYVSTVIFSNEKDAHGPAWQHVMQSIGLTTDAKYSGPSLKTIVQRDRENELHQRLKNNQRVGWDDKKSTDEDTNKENMDKRRTTKYTVFRYVNPTRSKDHPIVIDPWKGFGYMHGWEVKKNGEIANIRSTFDPDFVVLPGPLKIRTPLYRKAQELAEKMNTDNGL